MARSPRPPPGADPQGEVYRELVLAVCRFYHQLLPNLFEGLDDATELLLPDDLLTDGSIAAGFRRSIHDADCDDVEILGWLYQFYIAEKKKEVMARKKAVPTEDIPAVTQLFTPHWIVRYLVENSLGRLWLLNRPASKLREHMPYYIEGEPRPTSSKSPSPRKSACSIPPSAAGTCSPTPSTCSVSSTRRRATPQRDSGPDPAAQPLRARDLPPVPPSSPSWRLCSRRGNRRGASSRASSWYGRRSSSCRTCSLKGTS